MKIKVPRNFCSLDAPFNLQYYDPDRPESQCATMGCYAEGTWILVNDGENTYRVDIAQFVTWPNALQCKVWDSLARRFVTIKNVIVNQTSTDWRTITFSNGSEITATADHRFEVAFNGTKYASELQVGDIVPVSCSITYPSTHIRTASIVGICQPDLVAKSYCLETETDYFDANGIAAHNCRTRVLSNTYDPEHAQVTGRGNLFFTTVNLPYVALLVKESLSAGEDLVTSFIKKLDEVIDDVIDFSKDRFEIVARRKAKNYPFMMGQHIYLGSETLGPEDEIREVIKQGSITMGFIGLAETLITLCGKHHGESEEAQKLGLKIIGHMRERMDQISEETHMNWTLMGTPAEGCCGRLLRLTRKRFGVIPGVTDHAFLTNSSHLPVYFPVSAYDKIRMEAPYHALENAGHILYVELDNDTSKNLEAFEQLVTFMAESDAGYFSINHPVDHDPVCGYTGVIGDVCPRCGRHENEGVPAGKLLELGAYTPDPVYAIRPHMLQDEADEVIPNTLELS